MRSAKQRVSSRGELTTEQMVVLVLFAAAALILITFWVKTQYSIEGLKDIEACKLSVEGYAKLWTNPTGTSFTDFHLVQPDCKRRVITFTKNHVEMNGKKVGYYDTKKNKSEKSYRTLTPDIVNSVAASEMATCWYEFLEGKSYWTNDVDIGNDNTACFVCGELHFDKDAKGAFTADQQTPFFSFLSTNPSRPYPKVFTDRPTYLNYLYLQPHLCDHSGDSFVPGTGGDTKVLFIGSGTNETKWYDQKSDQSCEEQFLQKVLIGKKISDWDVKWSIPLLMLAEPVPVVDPVSYDPPMRDLKLTTNQSYVIIFYQLGKDKDTKENSETGVKEVTGTTYAPIIIPSSKFSTKMCETFIG